MQDLGIMLKNYFRSRHSVAHDIGFRGKRLYVHCQYYELSMVKANYRIFSTKAPLLPYRMLAREDNDINSQTRRSNDWDCLMEREGDHEPCAKLIMSVSWVNNDRFV